MHLLRPLKIIDGATAGIVFNNRTAGLRMYQSYFGLTRQAFSAAPDADICAGVPTMIHAFDSLVRCLTDGRGIGIVTAPAGLGKTILCQTIAEELADSFATVLLPNVNFATRRSFLQAVLCELGQPYVRMSEQELRLELVSTVRSLRPRKIGLALLLDEAHLLSGRLLEEARTLTNLFADGIPLVRLLLSGQLPLEENLATPSLEALNQRIGCHVTLEPLTRQESAEYIAFRLNQAGADPANVFSEEALSLICHASDGVPRCLNQLCDHSLLLAFRAGERPVGPGTVRTALDDLKQLPLHWNELSGAPSPAESAVEELPVDRLTDEPVDDLETQITVEELSGNTPAVDDFPTEVFECGELAAERIEIGGDDFAPSSPADSEPGGKGVCQTGNDSLEFSTTLEIDDGADESGTFEIGAGIGVNSVPASAVESDPAESVSPAVDGFDEEAVVDLYARLDAEYAQPDRRTIADGGEEGADVEQTVDHPAVIAETSPPEQDILATVLETCDDAEQALGTRSSVSEPTTDESESSSSGEVIGGEITAESVGEAGRYGIRYEYDVVHPEPDDRLPSDTESDRENDKPLDQAAGRGSASRRRQYDELVRELRRRYRKQA